MSSRLETLLTESQIQARIREMANAIDALYASEANLAGSDVLLIGVLKGSVHFLSDLARALKTPTSLDFIQVSSYLSGKSSTGVVQIRKDLDINIEGRRVLIVEDIVDTGATLKHLRELLSTRNPLSIHVAALLSKPDARKGEVVVEFTGFEIPNEFVVGYGLDYAERFRNLPYIAILRE